MSAPEVRDIRTPDDLAALFDAFNRHDIDAVMSYFDPQCVFDAVGGEHVYGTRHDGHDAIAKAFSGTFAAMPDARWDHHGHLVQGDSAVSQWTFTGTNSDGTRVEAEGADIFRVRNGKLVHKQAFRKQRPVLPAR